MPSDDHYAILVKLWQCCILLNFVEILPYALSLNNNVEYVVLVSIIAFLRWNDARNIMETKKSAKPPRRRWNGKDLLDYSLDGCLR